MIILTHEPIIEGFSRRHGLDPLIVKSLVLVESGGYTWAWNPEPRYRYLWDVKRDAAFRRLTEAEIASKTPPEGFYAVQGDRDQEFWAQQASWGLMQVMGAVAREMGFKGPYLPQLCEPSVGVEIGCLYLARLLKWANGNIAQALAAYNGGFEGNRVEPFRNQAYVTKVFDTRAVVKQQSTQRV